MEVCSYGRDTPPWGAAGFSHSSMGAGKEGQLTGPHVHSWLSSGVGEVCRPLALRKYPTKAPAGFSHGSQVEGTAH